MKRHDKDLPFYLTSIAKMNTAKFLSTFEISSEDYIWIRNRIRQVHEDYCTSNPKSTWADGRLPFYDTQEFEREWLISTVHSIVQEHFTTEFTNDRQGFIVAALYKFRKSWRVRHTKQKAKREARRALRRRKKMNIKNILIQDQS